MGYSEETHIQHVFDSFCKKVVRNEALNIQKKYARFRKCQFSMEMLEQKELAKELYYFEPKMNSSDSFIVLDTEILIFNEELANAISKLNSLRQKIILMSFFIGLNDREIGEIIGKSIGSVWYQRKSALVELEKYLGDGYDGE